MARGWGAPSRGRAWGSGSLRGGRERAAAPACREAGVGPGPSECPQATAERSPVRPPQGTTQLHAGAARGVWLPLDARDPSQPRLGAGAGLRQGLAPGRPAGEPRGPTGHQPFFSVNTGPRPGGQCATNHWQVCGAPGRTACGQSMKNVPEGQGGHCPEPGSAPVGASAAMRTYPWVLTSELGTHHRVGLSIQARHRAHSPGKLQGPSPARCPPGLDPTCPAAQGPTWDRHGLTWVWLGLNVM